MKFTKNFWLYAVGRFISYIGSGIQMVALPLYILDKTGSGTLMGIFSILTLAPALIAAPFSGILGDRRNRRNLMIFSDIVRGSIILLLGLLAISSKLSILVLFLSQVLVSIMDSLFNSSSGGLMPDLVDESKLMEATSVRGGIDGASMVIGPFLGGLIYAFGGIQMVFYLNGASFLICAFCSCFIKYKPLLKKKDKLSKKVFIGETSETLSFIRKSRGLYQLFIFAMISNFLQAPLFDIVFPYALKKKIGFPADKFGYIFGCFTLGVAIGNIALGAYFKKLGPKKLMKFGFIVETTAMIIGCSFMHPSLAASFGGPHFRLFLLLSISTFVMGFTNAFVNTPISTNLQKMVPSTMRSRFFSILGMFSQGAIPVGSFIYGILLDIIPYFSLIAIVVSLSTVVIIIFLKNACDEVYEPHIVEELTD